MTEPATSTKSPLPPTLTEAELNILKAEIERDRLQTEKDKLALERSFAKKWATPLLGLAGVIIAGFFSVAALLVASIYKEADDRTLSAQRDATATAEAKSREDRLKLDFANFMMVNWPAFSMGTTDDRQAIIIVTAELFPQYVSRNIIEG
jgi:hypothetical protein